MLDWSMVDLARAASISVSTVKRSEHAGPQPVSDDVFVNIQSAFEKAGVCFSDEMGEGIVIRLRLR